MNLTTEFATESGRPSGAAAPRHKLIITGTGRAGTTFLVRLLTALGADTGYDRESWREDYFPHCAAGLERDIRDPDAPYIIKNPALCLTLDGVLQEGGVVVDHALIPIRDLESAALSRARIGGENGSVPGGLIGTVDPASQEAVLATRFHGLVHTLAAHDIPHTFLLFPRFVQDAEYAYRKLRAAFPDVDHDRFIEAFAALADPTMVHDFRVTMPAPPIAPAEEFREAQRAKRQRRRRQRQAVIVAIVLVATAAGWPWLHHSAPVGRRLTPAPAGTIRSRLS